MREIDQHTGNIRDTRIAQFERTQHVIVIGGRTKPQIKCADAICKLSPHVECRVWWHPAKSKTSFPVWPRVPGSNFPFVAVAHLVFEKYDVAIYRIGIGKTR